MYNPVYLTSDMLDVALSGFHDSALFKGEVLKGQVQALGADGLVTLLLKGRMIEAATEVKLMPGQELFLLVDELRDGRIYLKVLSSTGRERIEHINLSTQLMDAGITPRQENLLIARKLVEYNLPVNRENIESVNRGLSIMQGFSEKNLEAVILALSREIPLHKPLLTAIAQYISSNTNIAELLARIKGDIEILEKGGNTGYKEAAIPFRSEQAAPQLRLGDAEAIPVNHKRPESGRESNIPRILRAGATEFIEAPAPKTGGEEAGKANMSTDRGNAIEAMPAKVQADYLELIKKPFDFLQVKPEADGKPGLKIQSIIKHKPEIVQALFLLAELFKNKGIPGNREVLSSLLSNIEFLERELLGEEIFNRFTRIPVDNNACYYFSIPVEINQEICLCRLRINRESRRDLCSIDRISLVVSLDTRGMGVVLFHVNWHKGQKIELRGLVETEEVKRFMAASISELVKGLAAMGYSVDNHGINVLPPEETGNIKLNPPVYNRKGFARIDIII